ncbi:hypothetical protein [Rhodococcus sp. Q]|uniref:hypothetical protein n=1 Tax=Rhodococcus sp. Q TaxID=2502252 RepID=UPI0010F6854A|nr:hypothetical protein [Rhodococcus sp. Q]
MSTTSRPVLAPTSGSDPAPNPTRPAVAATAAALLGAVLLVAAPVLGVVGPNAGPAVGAAAAVALACAFLPPLLSVVALARRAVAVAGALLAGSGGVALGIVVLDAALWSDPIDANRLDLFRPLTAAHLHAGPGAVALLVGHVLAVVAGILGLVAVTRAAQADGYGLGADPALDGAPVARRIGPLSGAVAVGAALLLGAGAFGVPWATTDPVLVVHPLLGSNAPTAIGVALVVLAVLVVVAAALASESTDVAAAAVVGAGVGALGLFGSRVAAGVAAGGGVSVAAGSVVSALAALVLIAVGATMPAAARARARSVTPVRASGASRAVAHRARQARQHAVAGAAGVVSGALAVVGSLLPVLAVPDGVDRPHVLVARVALVAGAILFVSSTALLLPGLASVVRPAVAVVWAAQFAAVAAVLQAVVVAIDVPGVGIGAGTVLLGASALGAVATGALCWHAGSVERDVVDRSVGTPWRRAVLLVGVPAVVVSTIALALPLYTGPGYAPDSVTDWPWGWDTWGKGVLVVTLVVTVLTAARARPARAGVGAVGAALSMGVYLTGWPLTNSRIAEAAIGPGTWAAIMGVVLFVATAVVAVRPRRP